MNSSDTIHLSNEIDLSQEAWAGIHKIADRFNLSVVELLESLGQGTLIIINPDDLEDYLDVQESRMLESLPENQQRIPWEQIKQELGL